MQLRSAWALVLCANVFAQTDAAILRSQAGSFLSTKGPDHVLEKSVAIDHVAVKSSEGKQHDDKHESEPEPEPEPHKKEKVETTIKDFDIKTWKPDDVDIKCHLTKHKSITSEPQLECMCPLGEFWHFRIKKCVKQGAWGYECGFFPVEHWKNVCQDGLKCGKAAGADSDYGKHGAQAATCVPCEAKDKCLTGEPRRKKGCLKRHIMHGEACTAVQLTLSASGFARATEQEKAAIHVKDSRTAAAKATAEAKATATTSTKVEKTVTAKATADAVADSPIKVKVDGKIVGIVDSDQLKDAGHGSAEATATRTAIGSATEHASSTSKATASAKTTATAIAKGSANEWASAKVSGEDGSGVGKACVTIDEVRDILGLAKDQQVGPVWAARIISAGDKEAYKRAGELAMKRAISESKSNTIQAAKAKAKAQAIINAELEAEAKARENAARAAEAGASDLAVDKAEAKAMRKAATAAVTKASKKSKDEAVAAASKEAAAKAARMAAEAAQSKAKELAQKEAQDNALKHAAAQAKKDTEALGVKRAVAEKRAAASAAKAGEVAKKYAKADATAKALDKAG